MADSVTTNAVDPSTNPPEDRSKPSPAAPTPTAKVPSKTNEMPPVASAEATAPVTGPALPLDKPAAAVAAPVITGGSSSMPPVPMPSIVRRPMERDVMDNLQRLWQTKHRRERQLNLRSSMKTFTPLPVWMAAYPSLTLEDLGPNLTTDTFDNGQGIKIATYAWLHEEPKNVKGIVCFFHSYTMHTLFDFLKHQGPGRETNLTEAQNWVPKFKGELE
eukprot:GHVT01064685.1.p1 GENE.GHVT01064685.1~~GHVT01064685.1.p1  ORF type:complete len:217 (-),score=31.74 GHVT01064685.1:1851-2501(-)